MLLSVFTPTHNPRYLSDAHDSLKKQVDADWEWVIAPNGQAIGNLPTSVTEDPRVKVFPYEGEPKIGALKRHACDNCTGQAFVELDHDDLFVPDTLKRIAEKVHDGAGMVYSDVAVFDQTKSVEAPRAVAYDALHGWETYEMTAYGMDLWATRAFPISPRGLSEIYYAPDHVRAWSRNAYHAAGGHNPEMLVGDDHDLMIRTYLKGFEFAHTGTCSYLYRTHPTNTVKTYNAEIQQQQRKTRDQYLHKLVDEWTRRSGLGYLDIKKRGGSDKAKLSGLGRLIINADDNSVAAIRCYGFLQFIATEHIMAAWAEMYRVLTPGGWVCSKTPSTKGEGWSAPHYASYWDEHMFEYVTNWKAALDMGIEDPIARFQKARCFTMPPTPEHKKRNQYSVYADLCALKGQRQPGLVHI